MPTEVVDEKTKAQDEGVDTTFSAADVAKMVGAASEAGAKAGANAALEAVPAIVDQAFERLLEKSGVAPADKQDEVQQKQEESLRKSGAIGGPSILRKQKQVEASVVAARAIRFYIKAGYDADNAIKIAKHMREKTKADYDDVIHKGFLEASTFNSGGVLVRPAMYPELLEKFQEQTIARRMGARTWPMESTSGEIPKEMLSPTAYYRSETGEKRISKMEFGDILTQARYLDCIVPISQKMLDMPGLMVDEIVERGVVGALRRRADAAFIYGTGEQLTPKGVRYQMLTSNEVIQSGTDLTAITVDFAKAKKVLRDANVPFNEPEAAFGWVGSTQVTAHLETLRNEAGQFVYADALENGRLKGKQFADTAVIPETLDDGASNFNHTELLGVCFGYCLIPEPEQEGLEIRRYDQASFVDHATQKTIHLAQRGLVAISASTQHDFIFTRPEAAVRIKGTWGQ